MKHSTGFPHKFHDVIFGLTALLLTLLIWSAFLAPAAL